MTRLQPSLPVSFSLMAHGPQADNTRHPGVLFDLMLFLRPISCQSESPLVVRKLSPLNPGFLSILLPCFNPVHCIYLDYSGKFLNGLAFPPFPSPFQRVSSRHDIIIADKVTCPSVSINTFALTRPFDLQRIKQCRLHILLRWLPLTYLSCIHLNVTSPGSLSHINLQRKIIDIRRIYLQGRDFHLVPRMIPILRTVLSM